MERMQGEPTTGEFVGTKSMQEITPERQLFAEEKMTQIYDYHIKSHTHMWIVTVAHFANEELLKVMYENETPAYLPVLDADTLLMRPAVGCYICEEPYEPRIRLRKCPGEPKTHRR